MWRNRPNQKEALFFFFPAYSLEGRPLPVTGRPLLEEAQGGSLCSPCPLEKKLPWPPLLLFEGRPLEGDETNLCCGEACDSSERRREWEDDPGVCDLPSPQAWPQGRQWQSEEGSRLKGEEQRERGSPLEGLVEASDMEEEASVTIPILPHLYS